MKHWCYHREVEVDEFVHKLKVRVDLAGLILRHGPGQGGRTGEILEAAGLGDMIELYPPRQGCCGTSTSGQMSRIRGLLRGWKTVQLKVERAKELARKAEKIRAEAANEVDRPGTFQDKIIAAAEAAAAVEQEMYDLLDEVYLDLCFAGQGKIKSQKDGAIYRCIGGNAYPLAEGNDISERFHPSTVFGWVKGGQL